MVNKEFSKENVFRLIDSFIKISNEQFLNYKNKAKKSKKDSFSEDIYISEAFKSIGGVHLLQTLKDYLKPLKEKEQVRVGTVKVCESYLFYGIGCLEMENQFGFFKSREDVRPSQCTWIDKYKAEHLYKLFTRKL